MLECDANLGMHFPLILTYFLPPLFFFVISLPLRPSRFALRYLFRRSHRCDVSCFGVISPQYLQWAGRIFMRLG